MRNYTLLSLLTFFLLSSNLQADASVSYSDADNVNKSVDVSSSGTTSDSKSSSYSSSVDAKDTFDDKFDMNDGTSESVKVSDSTSQGTVINTNLIPVIRRILIEELGFESYISTLTEKDIGIDYAVEFKGGVIYDNLTANIISDMSKANIDSSTFMNSTKHIKEKGSVAPKKIVAMIEDMIQASKVIYVVLQEAQKLRLTKKNYINILNDLALKHSNDFAGKFVGIKKCLYNGTSAGNTKSFICDKRYTLEFGAGFVTVKDMDGILLSSEQVQFSSGQLSINYTGTLDEAYEETFGKSFSTSYSESSSESYSESDVNSHSRDIAIAKRASIAKAITENRDVQAQVAVRDMALQGGK